MHKSPTSGSGGYIATAVQGVPNASEVQTKSTGAHKLMWWLHNPCRSGGSPTLQSGGPKQHWPTNGPDGYVTTAI